MNKKSEMLGAQSTHTLLHKEDFHAKGITGFLK